MIGNSKAQQLDNSFNISYSVTDSCDMSLDSNNISLDIISFPDYAAATNILTIKCSNNTPYTLSQIPDEISSRYSQRGVLTGVNTGEKIDYNINAVHENGSTMNALGPDNNLSSIGTGSEENIQLIVRHRFYPNDYVPVVDTYVGISTIKLSF